MYPWLYWIPHTVQPRIYFSLILNKIPFFNFKKQLRQFSKRKHLLFMWKRTCSHPYIYTILITGCANWSFFFFFLQGQFKHYSEVEVNNLVFYYVVEFCKKSSKWNKAFIQVAELWYDISHIFFWFLKKKNALTPAFTTCKRSYPILPRLLTFHSSCSISPTKFYQQLFLSHLSCSVTFPLPNHLHQ